MTNNGQYIPWAHHAAGTELVSQQLLWWQQTYAQQYWAQYMHHLTNAPHALTPESSAPVVPPSPAPRALGAEPERPQQEAQGRAPFPAVGGVAQDDDDDGGVRAARDWLDWMYIGSRLAILLGVMYYYSSLPRFMLVTVIVAGIYLYQKAVHQRRAATDRNGAGANEAGQPAAEPAAAGADPANADDVPDPVVEEQPMFNQARQNNNVTQETVTPLSGFNVALNLLVGFFASLIPEVPAPEAIN